MKRTRPFFSIGRAWYMRIGHREIDVLYAFPKPAINVCSLIGLLVNHGIHQHGFKYYQVCVNMQTFATNGFMKPKTPRSEFILLSDALIWAPNDQIRSMLEHIEELDDTI